VRGKIWANGSSIVQENASTLKQGPPPCFERDCFSNIPRGGRVKERNMRGAWVKDWSNSQFKIYKLIHQLRQNLDEIKRPGISWRNLRC
jgi:hypothetical protein